MLTRTAPGWRVVFIVSIAGVDLALGVAVLLFADAALVETVIDATSRYYEGAGVVPWHPRANMPACLLEKTIRAYQNESVLSPIWTLSPLFSVANPSA